MAKSKQKKVRKFFKASFQILQMSASTYSFVILLERGLMTVQCALNGGLECLYVTDTHLKHLLFLNAYSFPNMSSLAITISRRREIFAKNESLSIIGFFFESTFASLGFEIVSVSF